MLRHLVALEFNNAKDARESGRLLRELTQKIEGCKNFRFEKCLDQDKERYYFYVDFANADDRQKYLDDQRHKDAAGAIIATLKDGLNSIFIFDREESDDFWQASIGQKEGGLIAYVPLTKDDNANIKILKRICANKEIVTKEVIAHVKPDCKVETFGGTHNKVLMIGVAGDKPIPGINPEFWARDSASIRENKASHFTPQKHVQPIASLSNIEDRPLITSRM
jgi:hypothetical protein